jgi:hypothetical protein
MYTRARQVAFLFAEEIQSTVHTMKGQECSHLRLWCPSSGYRDLKLTAHLQQIPRSRKCGSIHPLPPYVFNFIYRNLKEALAHCEQGSLLCVHWPCISASCLVLPTCVAGSTVRGSLRDLCSELCRRTCSGRLGVRGRNPVVPPYSSLVPPTPSSELSSATKLGVMYPRIRSLPWDVSRIVATDPQSAVPGSRVFATDLESTAGCIPCFGHGSIIRRELCPVVWPRFHSLPCAVPRIHSVTCGTARALWLRVHSV